jgi:hypothetical protein
MSIPYQVPSDKIEMKAADVLQIKSKEVTGKSGRKLPSPVCPQLSSMSCAALASKKIMIHRSHLAVVSIAGRDRFCLSASTRQLFTSEQDHTYYSFRSSSAPGPGCLQPAQLFGQQGEDPFLSVTISVRWNIYV